MRQRGAPGFSLVELLVATLFLGLLLAGMAGLYSASLRGWRRLNQDLESQRTLRLGLDRVAEDLHRLGCRFPPLAPASDPAVSWPGGLDLESGAVGVSDAFTALLDLPAPARAVLAEAAGGAPWVRSDGRLDLLGGDLALLLDGPWEWLEVQGPQTLPAAKAVPLRAAPSRRTHPAGARVQLVRTRRLVRYAVVPIILDRSGAVPCLVRFEAPLPAGGTLPRWSALRSRPSGPRGGREVVAERVSAFRIRRCPEPGLFRVSLSGWAPEPGQRPRTATLEVLAPEGDGLMNRSAPAGAGP